MREVTPVLDHCLGVDSRSVASSTRGSYVVVRHRRVTSTVRSVRAFVALLAILFGAVPLFAQLPDRVGDFTLEVVTDDVPGARQMAEAPDGTLFVGSYDAGRLYAVIPAEDGDAEVVVVDEGLNRPSGVVLVGTDLYVAAVNRILRYADLANTFRDSPEPAVVTDSLPTDRHHGWKYLAVGPDGDLFVPVGAPCNICERADDERYASILKMDPDTGETTVYAHGVRNSVGLGWHGPTGRLWFSENGGDWLGDDIPADEINVVDSPGAHYGYPYFHAGDVRDRRYGAGKDPADYVLPEFKVQAHSAVLGIKFYQGDQFPARYCGAMFIAEHGSWNRSSKVGYRVSVLRFADPKAPTGAGAVYEPFVDVWLNGETQTGRPNDVLVSRDGSLLISDDRDGRIRGAIYRISHAPLDLDLDPIVGCAETAHVSTFAPKIHETREGFVRVVNRSLEPATVRLDAFDGNGLRYGPVSLAVPGAAAKHFNSEDLEDGNPRKGLTGATGAGAGDWRIELRGDGVDVLSYVRTKDGFVTSLHDVAPLLEPVSVSADGKLEHRYGLPTFNPGKNTDQVSQLRLVNPGDVEASVTITATDDDGLPSSGTASVQLAGGASRTITSQDLESGAGLDGGGLDKPSAGKWRLVVSSDRPLLVSSLLESPTGHLTNLTTVPDNKEAGEGDETLHHVPLFPAAGDEDDRQGFVRIINRSARDGSVLVRAHDDTDREYETVTLALTANAVRQFNSEDLEMGKATKGIEEGIGPGMGDWRLELTSELDLDVLAYIRRPSDGFLTSMHDFVLRSGDGTHAVPFFNPADNEDQVSLLQILNTGTESATVTIEGVDDHNESPGADVVLVVPAGATRMLSAEDLETGGEGLTGSLGKGKGKWRLTLDADHPVRVMGLMQSPTGHLTNLSTAP